MSKLFQCANFLINCFGEIIFYRDKKKFIKFLNKNNIMIYIKNKLHNRIVKDIFTALIGHNFFQINYCITVNIRCHLLK